MTTTATPAAPAAGQKLASATLRASLKSGALAALASEGHTILPTVRESFDTACWSFDGRRHQITLGTDFATHINRPPRRVRTDAGRTRWHAAFGEQLLRHEAWHGRVTHRDLPALAAAARAKGVPFTLLNLFEDARIEACARKVGAPFGWKQWQHLKLTCSEPLEAFFMCVLHEQRTYALDTLRGPFTSAQDKAVADFYSRACEAPSTMAVLDLCVEWMQYWGDDAGGKRSDKGTAARPGTIPTLTDKIGEASDDSVRSARDAGMRSAAIEEFKRRERERRAHGGFDSGRVTVASRKVGPEYYFTAVGAQDAIDWVAARRMAQRLAQTVVAAASNRTARLASSGSRLHIPGVASQSERAFRTAGKRGGTPTLIVVVDMSSSMQVEWERHGRLFTAAVLLLLRQRQIAGHIVLTGGGRHAIVPPTITDADFDRLRPTQLSESIAATLEAVKGAMQEAHATVIYTDGKITDGKVDAGRWRARGVDLIGALVLRPEYDEPTRNDLRDAMARHFSCALIHTTGEALAVAIAAKLGNLANR